MFIKVTSANDESLFFQHDRILYMGRDAKDDTTDILLAFVNESRWVTVKEPPGDIMALLEGDENLRQEILDLRSLVASKDKSAQFFKEQSEALLKVTEGNASAPAPIRMAIQHERIDMGNYIILTGVTEGKCIILPSHRILAIAEADGDTEVFCEELPVPMSWHVRETPEQILALLESKEEPAAPVLVEDADEDEAQLRRACALMGVQPACIGFAYEDEALRQEALTEIRKIRERLSKIDADPKHYEWTRYAIALLTD